MAEEGQELASLDFANLIGGPLSAIIEAQAKSAITTANFIKDVGFDKNDDVVNVKFRYEKTNEQGQTQDFELAVPFLTMVPIPYITVDEASVEFNAKITSVREKKTDSNFKQDVQSSASGGWWVRASLNTQTSYQQQKSDTAKIERSYDMHVFVKVRNADMPRGTERLLDIMENVITQRQVSGVNAVSGVIEEFTDAQGTNDRTLKLSTVADIEKGWEFYIGQTKFGKIKEQPQDGKKVTVELDANFANLPAEKQSMLGAGASFEVKAPKNNAQAKESS